MEPEISEAEARSALSSIEQRRRQVIAEIDMPSWYWWGLALGWVVLGVIAELDRPWLALGATLAFGVGHSVVAQHVLSGRHRTRQLSVHPDLVDRHVRLLVVGFLVVLVLATIVLALLADADGARHPAVMASVVVAIVVLAGGPRLMAGVRRRAERVSAE